MFKNKKITFGISLGISFLLGILFFCVYQEWLIVYWNRPYNFHQEKISTEKKTVALFRLKNDKWVKEPATILWSDDPKENMKKLAGEWISWLEDEQKLQKKVTIQSVLFSPSGYEMYLSFDHNPFDTQWSIYQKECFIKALLKTFKENGCTASSLYFLAHHKPLQDPHLNFNEPWILLLSDRN